MTEAVDIGTRVRVHKTCDRRVKRCGIQRKTTATQWEGIPTGADNVRRGRKRRSPMSDSRWGSGRRSHTQKGYIVSTDSDMEGFWLVGRSRLRFAIASGVGETQLGEAFSKRTKVPAMWGRLLGSRSQHCTISTQTSSDRPRISRSVGREGRFTSRTSLVTAYWPTPENGRLCAKTYRSVPLGPIR